MALQLPRCAECGASIKSRDDENCRFCGALLPWELWDEISNQRIELVETDALSFEAAIYRVERSQEFAGASLRATRARRRDRPRPPRTDEHGNLVGEVDAETVLAFVGGFVLMVVAIILSKGRGPAWIIAPLAYAAMLATVQWRKRKKAWERFRKKRKASRERGLSIPMAAGILEIGPPREHAKSPDRGRVRTVVLHTLKGEHLLVAPEDLEIAAGDVGIATVRGVDLPAFQAMSKVTLSSSDDA